MTSVVLYILYFLGLGFSGAFLLLHRPRQWMRPQSVFVSGCAVLPVLYLGRALILTVIRGGPHPSHGLLDTVVSLGLLAAVVAWQALLLVVFLRFRRRVLAAPHEADPPPPER
ncbi:hypothetical protein [Streptomyces sp. NPDC021020]|uniref:hypothetical protein n=1 Tax=Streptomyces sp. NPDC021020 TaxID=3365109 RepID=UPI003798127F